MAFALLARYYGYEPAVIWEMPVMDFNNYMANISEVEAVMNGKTKEKEKSPTITTTDEAMSMMPEHGIRGPHGG